MADKKEICGFSWTRDINENPKKAKIQVKIWDEDNPEKDNGPELNYHEIGAALGFQNINHTRAKEIWGKFAHMTFQENLQILSKVTNIPAQKWER